MWFLPLAVVAAVTAAFLSHESEPVRAPRPNILLIVTDDQSPWTLSAYGNTVCQTPVIDSLAAAGYKTVNVMGGTNAWVAAGYPVEK